MQQEQKNMKRELALICAALFTYTALSNILYAAISRILAALGTSAADPSLSPYFEGICYILPMAASILILYREDIDLRLCNTGSVFFRFSPVLILAVYLPVQLAAGYINSALESVGIRSYAQLDGIAEGILPLVEALIFSAVLPAFLEEILFRGLILQRLRKYGDYFAVIVSSLLFVSLHSTLYALPMVFILALLFAYTDIQAGSILPSIFMHCINNSLSVALLWISLHRTDMYEKTVSLLVFLSLICLGVATFVYTSARRFGKVQKLSRGITPIRCFTSIALIVYLGAMGGIIFYLTGAAS